MSEKIRQAICALVRLVSRLDRDTRVEQGSKSQARNTGTHVSDPLFSTPRSERIKFKRSFAFVRKAFRSYKSTEYVAVERISIMKLGHGVVF